MDLAASLEIQGNRRCCCRHAAKGEEILLVLRHFLIAVSQRVFSIAVKVCRRDDYFCRALEEEESRRNVVWVEPTLLLWDPELP